jgi:uncharacterized delta-60 repeat protein
MMLPASKQISGTREQGFEGMSREGNGRQQAAGKAVAMTLALMVLLAGCTVDGDMAPKATQVNHAPVLQGVPAMPVGIVGNGVALQPDGKLVVAGNSNHDIALLRYNSDGSLDAGFGGGDGVVISPVIGHDTRGYSLVLLPDGRIMVTGEIFDGSSSDIALLRYNADGSPDASFGGGDGMVTTAVGHDSGGYSLALQPDGKLVVTGQAADASNQTGVGCCFPYPYRIALLRYNADGLLDAGFGGGDGIVTTAIGGEGSESFGYGVTIQPDGKLVVTGEVAGSNSSIALLRYNADGTLDAGFGGGDGIVTTPVAHGAGGYSLALQPDGKFVVTGAACNDSGWPGGADCFFPLLRYNADGTLDASFGGGDGLVFTGDSGDHSYYGNSVTLQPDGKLVLTAETYDFNSGISDVALLRYNVDGSLDHGFGGGEGIVTTTLARGGAFWGSRVARQADGKLVVAGSFQNSNRSDIALLRYNADGSFDPTFGSDVIDLRQGTAFSVSFPANRFIDPDGDALTYTATLATGAALPTWLSFNAASLSFAGVAPGGTAGKSLAIRITATDSGRLAVSHTASIALVP